MTIYGDNKQAKAVKHANKKQCRATIQLCE